MSKRVSVTIYAQWVSIFISVFNRLTPLCKFVRTSVRTSSIRVMSVPSVRAPVRTTVPSAVAVLCVRAVHVPLHVCTYDSYIVQRWQCSQCRCKNPCRVYICFCATLQYFLSRPASHSSYIYRLHGPRSLPSVVSTVYKKVRANHLTYE
jgi:hypothetical protein